MARIDNLTNFLTDVATSIRTKKGTTDKIAPKDFDTEIESIQSGGGTPNLQEKSVTITENTTTEIIADSDYDGLSKVSVITNVAGGGVDEYFITEPSNNTNWKRMVKSMPQLDLTTTDARQFFQYFYGTKLIQPVKDTSKITNMVEMFYGCTNLTTLDLSNFNTSNVTGMTSMFQHCTHLTHLDIRNFDFTKVKYYSNMFGSSATTGVPDNCEIIVKDDAAKTWITSKFSRLTNVKTVAEL